jgi:metal-sulfur cluster biosynthetic enzyme
MKLTKEIVLAALSHITLPNDEQNIVESGAIKNIHIFGTDVELDVEIKNPTLQYKKKVEVDCMKAIHDHAFEKSKIKVNLIINAPVKEKENKIKGNPIPGVKNIVAVSSGKGGVGKSTITANLEGPYGFQGTQPIIVGYSLGRVGLFDSGFTSWNRRCSFVIGAIHPINWGCSYKYATKYCFGRCQKRNKHVPHG